MKAVKISIEGNIGSGKSTLISRLCQETRIPVFLEPVDEWKEWLSLFYSNPQRWGMSFNLNVLLSFNKWKDNNFTSIYERSPISNRYIFAQLQYDQKRMNDLELNMFERIYDQLAWTPDVIIYIRTDPETSMERMNKRGRECENGVPIDYIKAVHNKYEDMLVKESSDYFTFLDSSYIKDDVSDKNKKCRIIVVDGNRSEKEVYEEVKKWVMSYIN